MIGQRAAPVPSPGAATTQVSWLVWGQALGCFRTVHREFLPDVAEDVDECDMHLKYWKYTLSWHF